MPSRLVVTLLICFEVMYLPQMATAQQLEPAAVVTLAAHASVGITSVSSGSTIFSGDVLKTDPDGQLQFRSGSTQFALEPDSSARIFKANGRIIIELSQGAVTYSTT